MAPVPTGELETPVDGLNDNDAEPIDNFIVAHDFINDSDNSVDSGDDNDDDDDDPYSGYQMLPTEPQPGILDNDVIDNADVVIDVSNDLPSPSSCTPPPQCVQSDFETALASTTEVHLKESDFKIEHKPRDLPLDEAKIDCIKSCMSAIKLPEHQLPKWVGSVAETDWKNELSSRIDKHKKGI